MTDGNNRKGNSPSAGRSDAQDENGPPQDSAPGEAFTAEKAVNAAGFGLFQIKLTILSGFVWMAKGFEVILSKYIGSLVTCSWEMKKWHGALLTTMTCFATVLGCFLYGIWADKYGRRTALSSCLIFIFVFGAVSAGLPSYTWFIIFRSITCFAVGGLPQALSLCTEYFPGQQRGRAVFILSCFWAFGVVVMISLLYATLETSDNWRLFVAFSALPSFIAMVMMRWFPESFRFLLGSNQYLAANTIMAEMLETNKKELPSGCLCPLIDKRKRGRISELLNGNNASSTFLFLYMGLATAVTYYGLDSMTPFLTRSARENDFAQNATAKNFLGNLFSPVPCLKEMNSRSYIETLWTHALDFPGFVIYIILVDVINRKILLSAVSLLSSAFTLLLHIPTSNIFIPIGLVYCSRTLLIGQFDLLLLMVSETYPTTHRGVALGLETASFFIGQFLSSYVVEGLKFHYDAFLIPISLIGGLMFLCSIAAVILPKETRGKELLDVQKTK